MSRTFFNNPVSPSVGSFTKDKNSGYTFVPSEEGQKLLDYFRTRYNVPLEVRPVPEEEIKFSPGIGGYFQPFGSNPAGYGGSADPVRKTVYLNPNSAEAHVLAHEAGHAYDPVLLKSTEDTGRGVFSTLSKLDEKVRQGSALQNPKAFLNTFIDFTGPRTSMRNEVTAQRTARDVLKQLNIDHPEISSPWFKQYPRSFVDSGINSATAALTVPSTAPTFLQNFYLKQALLNKTNQFGPKVIPGFDANTQFDISDERQRRLLNLALDPRYTEAAADIESRTKTYIDRELGNGPSINSYNLSNLFYGKQ